MASSNNQGAENSSNPQGQNSRTQVMDNNGDNNANPPPNIFQSIVRWMLIYMAIQSFGNIIKGVSQNKHKNQTPNHSSNQQYQQQHSRRDSVDNIIHHNDLHPSCLWNFGTRMNLRVFITDSKIMTNPLSDCLHHTNNDGSKITNHKHKNNDSFQSHILQQYHQNNIVLGAKKFFTTKKNTNSPIEITSLPSSTDQNITLSFDIPHSVQYNQTHLYAHICLIRSSDIDESSFTTTSTRTTLTSKDILHKVIPLTKYKKRKKNRIEKNLMQSSLKKQQIVPADITTTTTTTLQQDEVSNSHHTVSPLTTASMNTTHDQILLYLKPSLTLQFLDMTTFPTTFPNKHSIPKPILQHLDFYNPTTTTTTSTSNKSGISTTSTATSSNKYYPIVYNSEFWIISNQLRLVNDTFSSTSIDLIIQPDVPFWKWTMMAQMEESWRRPNPLLTGNLLSLTNSSSSSSSLSNDDDENYNYDEDQDSSADILRTMLLETNPILLGITFLVSILHSIFDILAFKNDISFFKGKKSMEGLSLRSMIVQTCFQIVILLYLFDNDTSYMVLMSNLMSVLIEIWKISRAVKITFVDGKLIWEENYGSASSSTTNSAGKNTSLGNKTKEYDEIAMEHLMFVTMPLVLGYGVYSLFHQTHKGWYSWILNTLVGFIYMFGFIMMTPQLFINYKLQSVAHLNWRTMTYKSINTFIDDLFAFVIKMPIMHRLACLRDDVIFLIFCYQRYKYKTDYTRVNEYGQCAQPTEEMLQEVIEQKIENEKEAERSTTVTTSSHVEIRNRRGARDRRI